jgi:hypothetical protein
MVYEKMKEYIETIWSIFHIIKEKAKQQQDKKLEMISLVIYNYVSHMAKSNNITFSELKKEKVINLTPFFEYMTVNNIQLYDLKNIKMTDVDVTNKADLEKYTLSQIYILSQNLAV